MDGVADRAWTVFGEYIDWAYKMHQPRTTTRRWPDWQTKSRDLLGLFDALAKRMQENLDLVYPVPLSESGALVLTSEMRQDTDVAESKAAQQSANAGR